MRQCNFPRPASIHKGPENHVGETFQDSGNSTLHVTHPKSHKTWETPFVVYNLCIRYVHSLIWYQASRTIQRFFTMALCYSTPHVQPSLNSSGNFTLRFPTKIQILLHAKKHSHLSNFCAIIRWPVSLTHAVSLVMLLLTISSSCSETRTLCWDQTFEISQN